jgi:precorrin-2 methylase
VGEFQRSSAEWWRIAIQPAAWLAVPLTVAVHRLKKPFIYAGFNNLMTDETQMGRVIEGVSSFAALASFARQFQKFCLKIRVSPVVK